MRRIQFFEMEDQHWLPPPIRNGITDFLQFATDRGDLYHGFAARLAEALRENGDRRVLELCSGAGGPMKAFLKQIPEFGSGAVKVHLTDLYPNLPAFSELAEMAPQCFSFSREPVSVLAIPPELAGFRTLFTSFHHFDRADAVSILRDAVAQRRAIGIAESTQRHVLVLLYMLFTPLLVLLTAPFHRPFHWAKLFWTYVLPVVPLAVAFDGIVSCLRTYTPEEMMDMVRSVPGHEGYVWQTGIDRMGALPVGVTWLIGLPKAAVPDIEECPGTA